MDIKTANCIGILSSYLMKAYETAEMDQKLDYIKSTLKK